MHVVVSCEFPLCGYRELGHVVIWTFFLRAVRICMAWDTGFYKKFCKWYLHS